MSADGATLKYFTYIGATKEHTYLSNLIVDGDIVTVAQELDDFDRVYSNLDRTYLNVIPPTPGSINTISNSSGVASDGTGLFRYNTAVAGQGSLVKAAYFGKIIVKKIKKDNSGNIFLVGTDYKQSSGYQPDFWSSNPITKYQDLDNERYPFLLKVDYALSTILYASPIGGRSSHPEQSSFSSYSSSSNGIAIDIDNENNIIFSCVISLARSSPIDLTLLEFPAAKTNIISTSQFFPVVNFSSLQLIYKIPGNSLNTPSWVNLIEGMDVFKIAVDGKNRIHLNTLRRGGNNPILTNGVIQEDPFLNGANYTQ